MRAPRPVRSALLVAASLAAAAAITAATLSACGDAKTGVVPSDPVAFAAWKGLYVPPTDRIPSSAATNPGTPWGDYLGSASCAECHRAEYDAWRRSYHSKTLYAATPDSVFGDFSGKTSFRAPERAFHAYPRRVGDRFAMRVERNASATEKEDTYGLDVPSEPTGTFEVLFAFGNRRDQPYVAKARDGQHWVLPVVWDDREKAMKWDGWRPYVNACAGCHVTGVKTTDKPRAEKDLMANTWGGLWNVSPAQEGWADGGVGCENCHGTGRAHAAAVRRMGVEGYRAYLKGGGPPTIYNPKNDTPVRRMQQCDTCHTFTTESAVAFRPSPTGYGRDPKFEPLDREKFRDTSYYPDGSEMAACTVGIVFRRSTMAKKGVECRDCHDVHGSARFAELSLPNNRNQLCLKCHEGNESGHFKDDAAVAAHTRHRIDGPGSLCVECHMPRDKAFTSGVREHGVVQFMSRGIHSHTFSIPTGHEADRGGPPSACNACHTDKDAIWTQEQLRRRGKPK